MTECARCDLEEAYAEALAAAQPYGEQNDVWFRFKTWFDLDVPHTEHGLNPDCTDPDSDICTLHGNYEPEPELDYEPMPKPEVYVQSEAFPCPECFDNTCNLSCLPF